MKKNLPIIMIILVFILGISVFLYPSVSNYLYEKNSTQAIVEHSKKIEKLTSQQIEKEKKAAVRYNKSLYENAVVLTDPFDPDAYPITDGEYSKLLAFDDVMAYIEIPAINVYLPIYHGTKEETLQKGVGHLENTSLPIGGKTTHAVLSAHCGLPSANLFTDLHLLKKGNIFRIHVLNEVITYQVYDIDTVLPDDTSTLHIQEGQDLVTLITCTPYGKNTHRLFVHGRRIIEENGEKTAEPTVEKSFTWDDFAKIAAIVISAVFVLLLFGSLIARMRRKKKEKQ